jgi:hypothetical protein
VKEAFNSSQLLGISGRDGRAASHYLEDSKLVIRRFGI